MSLRACCLVFCSCSPAKRDKSLHLHNSRLSHMTIWHIIQGHDVWTAGAMCHDILNRSKCLKGSEADTIQIDISYQLQNIYSAGKYKRDITCRGNLNPCKSQENVLFHTALSNATQVVTIMIIAVFKLICFPRMLLSLMWFCETNPRDDTMLA